MSQAPPPLLMQAMLNDLGRHWERQQAPLLSRLQPGLGDAAIDDLVASLGLRVPAEARTWWGWHDGVPASAVVRDRERSIGAPSCPFLPLEEAVEVTLDRRVSAAGFEEHPGDEEYWRRDWLVLTVQRGPVVIDSSASRGPVPVHLVDYRRGPSGRSSSTRRAGAARRADRRPRRDPSASGRASRSRPSPARGRARS